MRVLLFPQGLGLGGGPERQISYLAHGLAERGHHVAIATLHTMKPDWEEVIDPRAFPTTVFFPQTPKNAFSTACQAVSATRKLRRLLREEQIDCIYCRSGQAPPLIGWLASRNMPRVQVIWTMVGVASPFWRHHRGSRPRLIRHLRNWVSPTVPLLISCSSAAQAGAEAAGFRCSRHVVIYNGTDTERFRPDAAARSAIRSEWGIAPDKKLVGIVALLAPVKGHPIFLEAARIMSAERDDLRFVCVGDGPEPYRQRLQQMGQELGLGERLIWAGARPYKDMPAVFNAMDVHCLSSYTEGFGNVLAEAMACGIPCVAPSVGGIPEVLRDFGVTVTPDDPVALARGVLATLGHEPRANELRRHVIENFSVEAMVNATERELQALVGIGKP